MSLSRDRRIAVRRRAQDACEYCHLPQTASLLPLQVDHIIAGQHGGSDDEDNLCLCCIRCNLKKGPNLASVDSATGEVVRLFHPRQQRWSEHFSLAADGHISGLTAIARATVQLLEMNDKDRVQLRLLLMKQGWRP